MKTCYKCKEEKPFSDFYKNRTKKDGLCNECKICVKEYNKSYYKKIYKERKRKQYQENNFYYREYSRKYYQENKERKKEYDRKYKQENKDLIREHNHKYHKNLPAGVYKITNTINGKIYVGESTGYPRRFIGHKTKLKRGVHDNPGLQTDYNQHSLDIFDFQVIEEHPPDADKKLLLERERYFINKYKEEGKELYNVDWGVR